MAIGATEDKRKQHIVRVMVFGDNGGHSNELSTIRDATQLDSTSQV